MKLQTIIGFLQPVCTVYVLRKDAKSPIKTVVGQRKVKPLLIGFYNVRNKNNYKYKQRLRMFGKYPDYIPYTLYQTFTFNTSLPLLEIECYRHTVNP